MIGLLLLVSALPADPVLRDLEGAFVALEGAHPRGHALARRLLVRATAVFEDTQLDGSDVEKAFASDRKKPYRGRPHERVLAHVVLAALEMERGRCDLALPSLKSAAFFDLKSKVGEDSDAVVVHALLLRCLIALKGTDAEIQAARDAVDDDVAAAVLRPGALLVLRGRGPRFAARGSRGETVVAEPRDDDDGAAIVIGLGRSAHKRSRVEIAVWSSFEQATSIRGRPFDKVLAERARFASSTSSSGQRNLDDGGRRLVQARSRADVVAGGLFAVAGAGMLSMASLTDARADDRFVDALPGRAALAEGGTADE
ncbi:MAG: hypothetical protein Q8O67_06975 [Deltaproteobacteria bacterium]|nr:hypothetical protein [Deltaproteobacteria bacterium]